MRALVTGTGGQLGRALVAAMPEGWDVVACDRAILDLTDGDAIRALVAAERPDFVFNAAAYTAVDRAESEPDIARAVNAGAVGHFASALRETGGRLVHVSTDFVFDGKASTPYATDAVRNPLSIYGRTKAGGEDAAGEGALIVRTSWVYAPGGANFVRTMLRLMRERDELRVVADQVGSPTLAAGLSQTLIALAEQGATGLFHHRDAGIASWYDFAVAIAEEARAIGLLDRAVKITPIRTSDYPTPAVRPAWSVLDVTATREFLHDESVHWRDNLRTMLKQEQALG